MSIEIWPVPKDKGNSNRDGAGLKNRHVTVGSLVKLGATQRGTTVKQLKPIFDEKIKILNSPIEDSLRNSIIQIR